MRTAYYNLMIKKKKKTNQHSAEGIMKHRRLYCFMFLFEKPGVECNFVNFVHIFFHITVQT